MTGVPEEPQSWAQEPEGEALLGDLRKQLDAVKARLTEHKIQMQAAGLAPPEGEGSEPTA